MEKNVEICLSSFLCTQQSRWNWHLMKTGWGWRLEAERSPGRTTCTKPDGRRGLQERIAARAEVQSQKTTCDGGPGRWAGLFVPNSPKNKWRAGLEYDSHSLSISAEHWHVSNWPSTQGIRSEENRQTSCPMELTLWWEKTDGKQIKYIVCAKEKKEGENGEEGPGWGRGAKDQEKRPPFKQGTLKSPHWWWHLNGDLKEVRDLAVACAKAPRQRLF